jgi:hypothetical protein
MTFQPAAAARLGALRVPQAHHVVAADLAVGTLTDRTASRTPPPRLRAGWHPRWTAASRR